MIYDHRGRPLGSLLDFVRQSNRDLEAKQLKQAVELLNRRNPLLQDGPWREPCVILDQFGRNR